MGTEPVFGWTADSSVSGVALEVIWPLHMGQVVGQHLRRKGFHERNKLLERICFNDEARNVRSRRKHLCFVIPNCGDFEVLNHATT